jgi:hypothetical protein
MDSKTRSLYLDIIGAMLLLVLLSLEPYAPSVALQYQLLQSPIIIVESSNENMTTASSHANAIISSVTHERRTTMTTGVPNATLVEFVSSIEQIRGHLDQALVNKESRNNTLAQTHALHPIEEKVYSNIEDQLANQSNILNQTLSAALQNLPSSVTDAVLRDFESQIDYVNMLLNGSVQAVVPSSELDNNPAFNASVIVQLLDLAEHEYEEAVSNSIIREIAEYQDAQAFIHRAESIFKSSASRINQSLAHEVEAVNSFFSVLNSSVNNRDDPETIDATIHAIRHMLVEITGLSENQLIGKEEETDAEEEEEEEDAEGQDSVARI